MGRSGTGTPRVNGLHTQLCVHVVNSATLLIPRTKYRITLRSTRHAFAMAKIAARPFAVSHMLSTSFAHLRLASILRQFEQLQQPVYRFLLTNRQRMASSTWTPSRSFHVGMVADHPMIGSFACFTIIHEIAGGLLAVTVQSHAMNASM